MPADIASHDSLTAQTSFGVSRHVSRSTVAIDVSRLLVWLWAATFLVLWLGIAHGTSVHRGLIPSEAVLMFRPFDLDGERTIPAWYAAVLMWTAAALLALHARISRLPERRLAMYFGILAIVFVAFSLDEAISLHEALDRFVPTAVAEAIPVMFTWVIPAAPLLLLSAIAFVPFLLRLPRPTRILVATSGAIYVLGAFGM